jgi:hypothetical protein
MSEIHGLPMPEKFPGTQKLGRFQLPLSVYGMISALKKFSPKPRHNWKAAPSLWVSKE